MQLQDYVRRQQQRVTDTDEASQRTEQQRLRPVSVLGRDNSVRLRWTESCSDDTTNDERNHF